MKSLMLTSALALCLPFGAALAIDVSFTGTVGGTASLSSGQTSGVDAHAGANATVQARVDGESSSSLTTDLSATASAAGSLGSDYILAAVIGLIEDSNWSEHSLSELADIEGTLYHVNPWITADNRAAFEAALSANAGEIEDLQAAVYANFELDAWLAIRYAEASDVIAIGAAADGSLAVFVQ